MHVSSFVSTLTGSFSTGAAGNPTVAMIADRIASGRAALARQELQAIHSGRCTPNGRARPPLGSAMSA
jgi:hypothetical protein